jgi:hypothetical protein
VLPTGRLHVHLRRPRLRHWLLLLLGRWLLLLLLMGRWLLLHVGRHPLLWGWQAALHLHSWA